MFFVFRDSYVIYIWVMNILCTFHIFMYGYITPRYFVVQSFNYNKCLNSSIWPIDEILRQDGPGSNGSEEEHHIFPDWGLTIWCCLVSYPWYSLGRNLSPLQRRNLRILLPQPIGWIKLLVYEMIGIYLKLPV